jgi:hypothetical protein
MAHLAHNGRMQDRLDSYTVEVLVLPGCTCEAHGWAIQHAADCEAFQNELTAGQVHVLAEAFVALYDAQIEQGKRRRMLTRDRRTLARRAVRHADAVLGTQHRYA